jgi:hypothetical protein
VADEWRTEALNIIRQCRNLDWLILTKRPQNVLKMLPSDWGRRDGRMTGLVRRRKHDGGAAANFNPPARPRPSRRCLSPLIFGPGLGVVSIGSLSAARQVRRMLGTWNRTGRVICAISAATRVPRSFSNRCRSGKRSLPT